MLGGISRHREHTGIVAIAATVVLGLAAAPTAADGVPDFRPEQWGLQSINAQELWPETQGQGITVALPGASVHADHPDLVDNLTVDEEFGGNDGDADTGTAAAALVAGHGHGMDADGGVLGVAPDAGLLVLPTGDRLAGAVRHAVDAGAQVVRDAHAGQQAAAVVVDPDHVAVGEAAGPMAGLAVLRSAADRLPGHHRVALVRAELLRRDGQLALAAAAYDDAIATCPAGAERQHIIEQRASLDGGGERGRPLPTGDRD